MAFNADRLFLAKIAEESNQYFDEYNCLIEALSVFFYKNIL